MAIEKEQLRTAIKRFATEQKIPFPKALEQLREDKAQRPTSTDYKELFHSYKELQNLKDLPWVVDGIAHEQEVTVLGALPKHSKTWVLLSIVKALLTGEKWLGHFAANKAKRVVYYIPETGIRPFWKRLQKMRLEKFVKDGRLLVRTLSKDGGLIPLPDPRFLAAVEGADVFLDTFVRFVEGDESSASDISKGLAANVFGFLSANARSIWGAHHSPKDFENARTMSMQNMLRGSGDIGAFISNAYGLRQTDKDNNLIHVECLGGRDLERLVEPFDIQGIPYIDNTGDFKLVRRPGESQRLDELLPRKERPGRRPSLDDKTIARVKEMKNQGKSVRQITHELKNEGIATSKDSVRRATRKF